MTDFDTKMAFIRALSVHGLKLYGDASNDETRERIRVTILMKMLEDKCFAVGPDHTMETYSQAFERCYNRKLEMRRMQREISGSPNSGGSRKAPESLPDDEA
jgi:hypothetical protein